jgi:hypothetical protein
VALEIPNAIVAALVCEFDSARPLGERFRLLSSNGIKGIIAQGELVSGPTPYIGFELETPVSAAEGCILQQTNAFASDSGDALQLYTAITKTDAISGLEAIPVNSLLALINGTGFGLSPVAFSVAVLKLPRG